MNDEMIEESDNEAIRRLQEKLIKEKNKPYVCQLCKMECSALYPYGKILVCINCLNDMRFMKSY